jgi:pimeloyl-ACP methyl ester carboxylesterase
MRQRFVAAGWPPELLFAISLSNPNSGELGINITHAGEIKNYIENTALPRTGAKRVDIIAHSMGGLATMYYAHLLNGAIHGEIADVVCLDCGVRGSTDPVIVWAIPDFARTSDAVKAVGDGDQTPAGVLPDPQGRPHVPGDMSYTFFWHKDDVNALAGGVSQPWPNINHLAFMTDPEVFTAVKAAVRQHEP